MDERTRTELEAAAFRRLVAHLRARTDVQNIDLMNLAGLLPQLPGRLVSRGRGGEGHHAGKGRGAGDRLRHAAIGVEKEISEGSLLPEQQAALAAAQKTHS